MSLRDGEIKLTGRTVFITAGANGMGFCFARRCAGRGANVVIADIDEAAAGDAAARLPSAISIGCDVRDTMQVERARDVAIARFGAVDLVLSHAGMTQAGPLDRFSDADWTNILDLNVIGMARVLRAFTPHMTERGRGHFILTSSSLALISGHPLSGFAAPYVASKAAVIGLAQSAAVALAPHGISVTLFAPDLTETGFAKGPPPDAAVPIAPSAAATLVPPLRQTPEQAVAVLMRALDDGAFLASATPRHEKLLREQVEAGFDPLAMAPAYAMGKTA
jgi:NAD(P)-dependent dehydrogenase (short-subunit alcohol dehydrogenase family)